MNCPCCGTELRFDGREEYCPYCMWDSSVEISVIKKFDGECAFCGGAVEESDDWPRCIECGAA